MPRAGSAERLRCGTLWVPLERADPSLGTIPIASGSARAPIATARRWARSSRSRAAPATARSAAPATTSTCSGRCSSAASWSSSTCGAPATRGRSTARDSGRPRAPTPPRRPVRAHPRTDFASYRTSAAADDLDAVRGRSGRPSHSTATPTAPSSAVLRLSPRRHLDAPGPRRRLPGARREPLFPSLTRDRHRVAHHRLRAPDRCSRRRGARLARVVALLRETKRGAGPLLTRSASPATSRRAATT